MTRGALVLVLVARAAAADPTSDAEQAFRAAQARGDIAALEAIAAGPPTRWTDNAWREAARLAEKAGDFARARGDYERAIAADDDDIARRRDQADLARIAARTGNGAWDRVVATQERVEDQMLGGADPRPALAELEQLARDNPQYPGRADLAIAIARGRERDGDGAGAVDALRAALAVAPVPADAARVQIALFHTLVGRGALDDADAELRALSGAGDSGGPGTDRPRTDPSTLAALTDELDRARARHVRRVAMWLGLGALAAAALALARRDAGSWRAALRRLVHPPIEVAFFVPIALVLAVVASTGNPLVARAVRGIALGGAAIAWVSGALLDGARPLRARRVALHALLAICAAAAACYLAVDRDRMLDLVAETWREGPQRR